MPRIATSSKREKRSLVLNLSIDEMEALETMAKKRGLTKSSLLRQALRLYESIDSRLAQGDRLYVEDSFKKDKAELLLL